MTTNYYQTCCARLARQADGSGNLKYFCYDRNGNTTGGTDESLRTTSTSFDGLNRQLAMTLDPGGSGHLALSGSTAYFNPTSGSIGQYTIATNPAGQQITTTLDGMGRVVSTSGDTALTVSAYDQLITGGTDAGLVVSTVTTGSGGLSLTTSAYTDGAGRVVKTVDGDGNATTYTFDGIGQVLTMTDPDSRVVKNCYDCRNRLQSQTVNFGGIGAKTCYAYDAVNNLLTVTDPDTRVTKYDYDTANRRTHTTYAYGSGAARTWCMTYKPLGQLASLTKPSGGTIGYSYDPRELLLVRTYGGTTPSATDSFSYYPNRLLATALGGLYNMNVTRGTAATNGTIGSYYDGANRLLQETQSFAALSKTMSYAYTPDSLVSQLTCSDGTTTIGRNYNADRLLYQVVINGGTAATFGYDTADRRTGLVFANGASTAWTLDNASRVTALGHFSPAVSGGTMQAWTYAYTPAGDPLAQLDVTTGTMGNAYQYDTMHRVNGFQRGLVIAGSNTVATPSLSQSWSLTSGGDWSLWGTGAASPTLAESRSHNEIHALLTRSTTAATLTQCYDSNWNQTDDGTVYKLVYDANDQLQQVQNRGTLALVGSYAYDAFGRRAAKFVTSGSASTVYFYSDQQVVQEFDGTAGTVNATYSYGDYVDEPLTMDRGGSRYYYHANRLYSVYLLSDSAGAIAERYSYTPYGVATAYNSSYGSATSTSALGNPYLFTGRELDSESLLYNYRARTYDPVQGRFKQLDPIGVASGANQYCYCEDSPLGFVDSWGLACHEMARTPLTTKWPPFNVQAGWFFAQARVRVTGSFSGKSCEVCCANGMKVRDEQASVSASATLTVGVGVGWGIRQDWGPFKAFGYVGLKLEGEARASLVGAGQTDRCRGINNLRFKACGTVDVSAVLSGGGHVNLRFGWWNYEVAAEVFGSVGVSADICYDCTAPGPCTFTVSGLHSGPVQVGARFCWGGCYTYSTNL